MPKLICNTKGMSHSEWLEKRKEGIGGSDAASIVGANKYKSPVVVYMEKLGLYEDSASSEAAEWGNKLEPIVRKEFVERINAERDEQGKPRLKVQQRNAIFSHDEHDFMRANVDGLISCPILGKGVLEVKTANQYLSDEWQGDDVPNNYYIQVQHYIAVMDVQYAYISVLIGGQRYKHYYIERDQQLIDNLIVILKKFWENNILTHTPPQLDGSNSEKEMLSILYPQSYASDEPIVNLPSSLKVNAESLDVVKELIDILTQEKQKHENEIKSVMGSAETAWIDQHKVTWKTASNGVRSFRILIDANNQKNDIRDKYQRAIDRKKKELEKEKAAAEKEFAAAEKVRLKERQAAKKQAEKEAKASLKAAQKLIKEMEKKKELDQEELVKITFLKEMAAQIEIQLKGENGQ